MNLRRARLDDYWRIAFKRNYAVSINSAEYSAGDIFDGMKLLLKDGVNAIVGRNGIGKSNLVRSLYNCFITAESNRLRFSTPLLENGSINIALKIKDVTINKILKSSNSFDDNIDVIGLMYDPCNLIPSIQNLFLDQDNLEELLDSFSQLPVDKANLNLINFLTNGDYQEVIIINIDDEFEKFALLPFFIVKTRDAHYDSRNMGLGELSLLYFYWLFSYMSILDKERILFIEEPESFLPPATQERFADILAMIAATQGVAIIMSTHSEHILKRIPRAHIQLMKRSEEGIRCFCAIDNNEPFKLLGLTSPKQGILLFEDDVAEIFIKSLLKMSARFVSDSFYYHKSGSDGDILKDLNRFPSRLEGLRIIGVFDGDCEGKLDNNLLQHANYCFLPEKLPPETVLINYIKTIEVTFLAKALNIPVLDIIDAKESSAGRDHHDYFHELARSIGLEFKWMVTIICDLWVSDDKNGNYILKFIEAVESFYEEK